ncbi:MAG: type II toxin-antitoxin system MqsA family antitoxin [Chloroflexi bacterium]|nr:type II toxin-antitoxin system MqsA family antitoxin [Chloroflexota bacterium]
MKCHVCGGKMEPKVTSLPFKVTDSTIVVVKDLPTLQCANCGEYLLESAVMRRVDEIIKRVDSAAELEVVRFAA